MSELTNLQKQLQTPEEGNTNLNSPQDNLEEEVLVDTMAVEAQSVWMKDAGEKRNPESIIWTQALNQTARLITWHRRPPSMHRCSRM